MVDPEEFAAQVNYLAALGRMVVPRAFAFAGRKALFAGHGPFDPEELASRLPEEAEWHEQHYAPDGFVPDLFVLGRDGFSKEPLRLLLRERAASAKVVPQEGFINELLFGHDWWSEAVGSLHKTVPNHRGLQIARSVNALAAVGILAPQPANKEAGTVGTRDPAAPAPAREASLRSAVSDEEFSWPSIEAAETRGVGDSEFELRIRSRLKELGYDTNQPPSARWRVLTTRAVPELGLPKVANMIAWFCRSRKQQKGGEAKVRPRHRRVGARPRPPEARGLPRLPPPVRLAAVRATVNATQGETRT